ncbi:hypothetical protein [Aureliella helgolandensis]|uniref:Uncharacterized protein n=1 Tax=Aureliella helgolandensis TaxID=2527968 RepID=A0A518GC84_9BACT|nr:hypothetical protein [Aureliella helgolandensis]QDV26183.1 hypothetical protein Q31a_45550 [Aureliella helgolandensis]
MSDQDSILNDLLQLLPGYGAYRTQESRRQDDRLAREFLSKRLNDCKAALDQVGANAVAGGDLESPLKVEEIRQSVELARNRLTAAVEGYSGWFNSRTVDAELLGKIVELDQNMVSLVDRLDAFARAATEDAGQLDVAGMREVLTLLQTRIDRRTELLKAA